MDYLLRYYIGYYHYPFIMDINADAEVWNFPAYAYSRSVVNNADGSQSVTTVVQYADPTYGTTGTSLLHQDVHVHAAGRHARHVDGIQRGQPSGLRVAARGPQHAAGPGRKRRLPDRRRKRLTG